MIWQPSLPIKLSIHLPTLSKFKPEDFNIYLSIALANKNTIRVAEFEKLYYDVQCLSNKNTGKPYAADQEQQNKKEAKPNTEVLSDFK